MKIVTLIESTSGAASVNSAAYDLGDITTFSIEVDLTGANVVGTLTLESRDSDTAAWKTVANSSQAITASGDHIWSVTGAGYRYVRVAWVYTSGTGNISSTLVAKENRVVGA